jgi:hypothetical protein
VCVCKLLKILTQQLRGGDLAGIRNQIRRSLIRRTGSVVCARD